MKSKIFWFAVIAIVVASCGHSNNTDHEHEHENESTQYTTYSKHFELFAEADPFIVGESSNILAHFTHLNNFKPLDSAEIKLSLSVSGKKVSNVQKTPIRKGIYNFELIPESPGTGTLSFDIKHMEKSFVIRVNEVQVFSNSEAAHSAMHDNHDHHAHTNSTVFTKEQSWKTDFSTNHPQIQDFGQLVRAIGKIQPLQGAEQTVSAKTSGIILLSDILEGKNVMNGQRLAYISGDQMAFENFSTQFSEAENEFKRAKTEYDRKKALADKQIISEKELLIAKTAFENSKIKFDNLRKNFQSGGQEVRSPMNGFIKNIMVPNGSFVDAGQSLMVVTQDKSLLIKVHISIKHAKNASSIDAVNVKSLSDGFVYSGSDLNASIVSIGKSVNNDRSRIPVWVKIDNKGQFFVGESAEVYLRLKSEKLSLTVPNTSIIEEQGRYFVYVQLTPELFEKREVTIAGTDGLYTEIKSGISQNDRIVSRGAIMLKLSHATGGLDPHAGHVH